VRAIQPSSNKAYAGTGKAVQALFSRTHIFSSSYLKNKDVFLPDQQWEVLIYCIKKLASATGSTGHDTEGFGEHDWSVPVIVLKSGHNFVVVFVLLQKHLLNKGVWGGICCK
jgi:hypothetical protein